MQYKEILIMDYTMEEKYRLIEEEVLKQESRNPVTIAKAVMNKGFVSIHGPEHHFLDGASFLMAYKNAGGEVDIEEALEKLKDRARKMPGAMCGYWGVCGSSASVGAALSILHKTGPLSDDGFYKDNMEYTSSVIRRMSEIGGPRCCKRNAFLSLSIGVQFANRKYGTHMESNMIVCEFSPRNAQCIKDRCPFHIPDAGK